jgi:hypothetical protein
VPHAGWAASRPRSTHTWPYTNGLPAGPGHGLWWTPAPCTSRAAMESARRPAAETVV